MVGIGIPRLCRHRVDELLGGSFHQVVNQWARHEFVGMEVEVLPHAERGQIQCCQAGLGRNAQGQPAIGYRLAHFRENCIDVDTCTVSEWLDEPWNGQVVLAAKPFDQRSICGGLLRRVQGQVELMPSTDGGEVNRHEDQRGLRHGPVFVWPLQHTEAQEERVHTAFITRGLGAVGHRAHFAEEHSRADWPHLALTAGDPLDVEDAISGLLNEFLTVLCLA